MKLTILGSGTYQPELDRHSAAYLIETNNGQRICFDFGRGAIDNLLKAGVAITQIDAIFVSHWHPDHVADFLSILHYTSSPLPKDLAILSGPRKKALKIYGPKGTKDSVECLRRAFSSDHWQHVKVVELENEEVQGDGWLIKSYLTIHNPGLKALCFRMEADGKILAYSGDTLESSGLDKAVMDADLAVIEASWPDHVEPKTHLTGERAGKIAAQGKVKKLVLTHIAPIYTREFQPIKDAQKHFHGEILEAEDMMEIEL